MKENINNFIVNDEDLNVDQLLDETLTLFGENSTTVSYTHLDVYKRQTPS